MELPQNGLKWMVYHFEVPQEWMIWGAPPFVWKTSIQSTIVKTGCLKFNEHHMPNLICRQLTSFEFP